MSHSNQRSARELKRSILHRAFANNDGARAILLLQWRSAACRHERSKGCDAEMAEIKQQEQMFPDMSRSVKMLNTLARHAGEAARFLDTKDAVNLAILTAPMPAGAALN